jgi:hypothetical protein
LKAIEKLAAKWNCDTRPSKNLPIRPDTDLPKLSEAEVEVKDYLSIVGSCLHICQVSRPDAAFAVGSLARHAGAPGKVHMETALDLVTYLYTSRYRSIRYSRQAHGDSGNHPEVWSKDEYSDSETAKLRRTKTIEERLIAGLPEPGPNETSLYIDADHAGDRNTRRSTSGMIIVMNGGPICWCSRLQKLCAQSSAESEIYAVTDTVKEVLHIRLLCEESGIRTPNIPMEIWEDNNACIQMAHNLRGSQNAKHFELRLRFLNEHVQQENIEFSRIDTKEQLADGFTKPLPLPAFREFRDKVTVNTEPRAPYIDLSLPD